jgi:methylated-DNA-[protein]-cysteine S-methyltransferase
MAAQSHYAVFQTNAGWVGILSSQAGVKRIILPRKSEAEVYKQLRTSPGQTKESIGSLHRLIQLLRRYFSGERVNFPDELDFSGATSFQRDVWRAAMSIPYGQSRSYKWVAERTGRPRAARAVGQALGKNPLPVIVPCHRVVANNGGPGGFSGGIGMKKRLLSLERIAVSKSNR